MTPLAYYMQAVMAREQEHMPAIGPSKDRQALEVDAQVWTSENVRSLMCFSCAQIHTSMSVFEKRYDTHVSDPLERGQSLRNLSCNAPICMHEVGRSLLRLYKEDTEAFKVAFDLATFKQRYASARGNRSNAFEAALDLAADDYESKRCIFLVAGEGINIICCPEDVLQNSVKRKHPENMICEHCRVPLCRECASKLFESRGQRVPAMCLGNDNLWGYTSDVISRYEV